MNEAIDEIGTMTYVLEEEDDTIDEDVVYEMEDMVYELENLQGELDAMQDKITDLMKGA